MSDNISRQAALDAVSYETFECYQARKDIRALPSTDRNGHWIMKTDPYGFFEEIPVCSECGHTTEMRKTYNFCPHCGADMRGEGDGR